MMPIVPKKFCKQSFYLQLSDEKIVDDYHNHLMKEPVLIEHVIIQPQVVASGANNDRSILGGFVIFMFHGVTEPFLLLSPEAVGSIIYIENHKYQLKKIEINYFPDEDKVYSYELEVY